MTEELLTTETGEEIVVSVEETVAESAAVVEEAMTTTVEAVAEPVAEAAAEVVAEVEPVAESMVDTITESVAEAMASVKEMVEDVVEAVSEPVAEAVAAAKEKVEDVVESVVETVTETATDAVAAVKEVVENVTEAVTHSGAEAASKVAAPVVEAAAKKESPKTAAPKTAAPKAGEKDDKRVVRTLSVGQMLKGTVKRTTEFGAFVDIGVGRDGLVHISELALGRVQKVTDVLKDGQQIDVWIKKLDQERNRISLTMISPDTTTIKDLSEGDVVPGTVTRIVPYGVFVDLGVGRDGLLHIREMSNGYVAKPEDVVKVGETTDVRIIALNRRRGRIDLSLKGLRPDDVPEVKESPRGQQPQQPVEEEPMIEVEEISVLSPMELAFKMAMEAEGIEVETEGKGRGRDKRSKRKQSRATQDAIIARTLETIRE